MNTITHLKGAESVIRDILNKNPETRNSDMELLFAVWQKDGVELTDLQKEMIKASFSPETVRRTRQKIQERGEYLPSKTVSQVRSKLQQEHRAFQKNSISITTKEEVIITNEEPTTYTTKIINGKTYRFAVYN